MGIIADLILIAFLGIFTFLGYKRGLSGSLFRLASFVLAIVIALVLYKPVSNYIIENTEIYNKMKDSIISTFEKKENEEQNEEESKIENMIVRDIKNDIEDATEETKNAIVEKSADKIATTIINIGTGIVVYLLAKIILVVVSFFIKGVASLPVIKQIDKTGGILYGLAEGFVIVLVVFAIIAFSEVMWQNNMVNKAVNKGAICSVVYNNNVITNMVLK